MEVLGDQLKEPEIGWRRYDDKHAGLKYTGSWYAVVSSGYYGGSINVTTKATDNNYVSIQFYGTKFRLISDYHQDRHSDNSCTIDGVTESFSANRSTSLGSAIVYEKTNLPLGLHTVTITVGRNRINFVVDAIDIDDTGYLYGYALTSSDDGWKRNDDSSSEIKYDGWLRYPSGQTGSYSNSFSASNNTVNKKATFIFKGTKLRLITMTHSDSTTIGKISIDGTPYDVSFYSSSAINQVLVFEKTGLEDSLHTIEVYSPEAKNIRIDAVDIDLDGRMFHPDEVTNIAELEVGKRIRCHYIAARNNAGVFSRLGEETFDFISSSGSPIPMGDFYWIMVEDWNKRKFLVADRNIQNTISWDSINKEGYVFGVESATIFKTHNKTPYLTSASDVYNVTGFGTSLTNEDPWRAFSLNGSNGWWGSYAGTGLILDCKRRVKFGEIKVVAFRGANMASVIDVYGSDNNVDYTLIKSCQKSTWIDSEQATFYFDEPVEYRYYKIMKTAQVSGSNAARLNLELSYSEEIDNNHIFKLRLLSGGINATDKDNEWDKYIVNSTLNGTIIAGDNNVWNYGGASWTSTTNSAGSANRTGRGANGNVGASGYNTTSYISAATATGFRPLIEIETLPMNRTFINYEGSYKRFDTGTLEWNTISATLPSEGTFISDGMDDLSVFDRRNEGFVQTMTANGSLGSGKMFKGSIDLKKYFEITNVSVK